MENERVYFALIGLLANNSGAHTALGFVKSFNATYPCRICLALKKDCNQMVVENPNLLRTRETYEKKFF